jgi:hypothetical protein
MFTRLLLQGSNKRVKSLISPSLMVYIFNLKNNEGKLNNGYCQTYYDKRNFTMDLSLKKQGILGYFSTQVHSLYNMTR